MAMVFGLFYQIGRNKHCLNYQRNSIGEIIGITAEADYPNAKIMDYVSKVRGTANSTRKFYIMDAVRNFLKRHDLDLVAVVEALGKEVNDTFSSLAIKEIDGDMYNIEEYDGKEAVITPNDNRW